MNNDGSNGLHGAEILIVDDHAENLTLLRTLLVPQGYTVRPALSGHAALQMMEQLIPDLVLLDVAMPEMTGFEVCAAIKADPRTRDVPVIIVSAYDNSDGKVQAFDKGAVDYITKPYQPKEILARIRTQLRLSLQRQEIERAYHRNEMLLSALRTHFSETALERLMSQSEVYDDQQSAVRETLTIMMTDVVGFTAMSERGDPHELVTNLSLYFSTLTSIVQKNGGEVDKFLGDGMLAFFRNPDKALEAAILMQRQIRDYNTRLLMDNMPLMQTRIGLATGRVLLANLGTGTRQEVTLIGDKVNVAARLEAQAPIDGILMDEETYNRAGQPAYALQKMVTLKGKDGFHAAYAAEFQDINQEVSDDFIG